MTDLKSYIFDTVIKRIGTAVQVDKEALYHGVCFYTDANELEKHFGGERAQSVLDMYLEPILEMPPQQLCDFFVTQSMMHQFQKVSGAIFDLAAQKYSKQPFSLETMNALERDLSQSVNAFINAGKLELIQTELSDCYVELDYLKNNSENISIRLMRRFRV